MSDIMFWVLLMIVIYFRLSAKIVNVKTGFLSKDMEEEIYMQCLPGMNEIGEGDCIILSNRAMA